MCVFVFIYRVCLEEPAPPSLEGYLVQPRQQPVQDSGDSDKHSQWYFYKFSNCFFLKALLCASLFIVHFILYCLVDPLRFHLPVPEMFHRHNQHHFFYRKIYIYSSNCQLIFNVCCSCFACWTF